MTAPAPTLPPAQRDELTTREAALYCGGMSVRTFWRHVAPHLTAIRYSLRIIRWPRAQLDAYRQAVTDGGIGAEEQARQRRKTSPGIAALLAKHGCVG